MVQTHEELIEIITKFSESGWEVLDEPSNVWLEALEEEDSLPSATADLIAAIEQADIECGRCGCEFDPLYKKALKLLKAG